jgi:hypothetical protein
MEKTNNYSIFYYLSIPILMTLMFVYFLYGNILEHNNYTKKMPLNSLEHLDLLPIQNIKIKDTVFVLGNSYVEILLKQQRCRLYIRGDEQYKEYKISSGTPFISEGMETSKGLFTVQNKNPLGISKQFNNAELHN